MKGKRMNEDWASAETLFGISTLEFNTTSSESLILDFCLSITFLAFLSAKPTFLAEALSQGPLFCILEGELKNVSEYIKVIFKKRQRFV